MEKVTLTLDCSLLTDAISQMSSPTIASSMNKMLEQRQKGIAKYGVSLEDAGLSPLELIEHARQEAADLSVYLAQLQVAVLAERARILAIVEEYAQMQTPWAFSDLVTRLRDELG